MVVGALLGPEGTGRPRGWGVGRGLGQGLPYLVPSGVCRGWRGVSVGVWLLVENCTVDASILVPALLCGVGSCRYVAAHRFLPGVVRGFCVVKLLRAHGGCLGTRSR